MRLILLTCLLIGFSSVHSIFGQTDEKTQSLRKKRWLTSNDQDDDDDDDNDDKTCPKKSENCPKCLHVINELQEKVCAFDIVAEVLLTAGKDCGNMRIDRKIKMDGIEDNNYLFSMTDNCRPCDELLGQTVTLLTFYDNYEYATDGFRLEQRTVLVKGHGHIVDCGPDKDTSKETSDMSYTSEAPDESTTISMTPEATPPTTTTTTSTMAPKDGGNGIIDRNWDKEENNDRDPRKVDYPEYNGHNGYTGHPGIDGSYGPLRLQPNIQRPNGVYDQNRMPYPRTQPEYHSPQYSSYNRPPGYLNDGYFTAQSLRYGAGRPPAVNPRYYYSAQYMAYSGPHYRPSRLTPKPIHYPKPVYSRNYTHNYRSHHNYSTQNYSSIVPAYRAPHYGSEPTHSNYSRQQNYPGHSYEPRYSNGPKYTRRSSYSPEKYNAPLLSYLPGPNRTYERAPGRVYRSEIYSNYSQSYTTPTSNAYNNYSRSLPQAHSTGYNRRAVHRSVAPIAQADYYASSSDHISSRALCPPISDSCPSCVSEITETPLMDSICDFDVIIATALGNHSSRPTYGEYANDDLQSSCASADVKTKLKANEFSLTTFFYSVNSHCFCRQLSEPSVLILSRSDSWSESGLSLSDKDLILKDFYLNSYDITSLLNRNQCN